MRPRDPLLLLAVLAFAVLALSCSGSHDSSNDPLTVGGMANTVDIKDFEYMPGNLQVPAGASVTFVNHDNAPHTATANDQSWDTGTLDKGESKTRPFDQLGEYVYYCRIHPTMKARVEVRASF